MKKHFGGSTAFSLILWVLMAGSGAVFLTHHALTPGQGPKPRAEWPAQTALGPIGSSDRLLIFAHPKCPCTRSTIRNLKSILAELQRGVHAPRIEFVFWRPDPSWGESSTITTVRELEGVALRYDDGGVLTRAFGAHTSGHAFLYAADGQLLFSGGLTPSRAHEGPAAGTAALLARARGGRIAEPAAPVYGCPILGEED